MEDALDREAIGTRMQAAAEAKGLDPYDVSKALGVKPPTVYRWYNAETRPSDEHMNAFAALVERPVVELLLGASLETVMLRWARLAEQGSGTAAVTQLGGGDPGWDGATAERLDRLVPAMLAILHELAGGDWRQLPEAEQAHLMSRLLERLRREPGAGPA